MTLSFQKKLIKLLHADSFFINYFTIIHAFDKTSGRINRPFPSPRFKIPLISKRIAKKTGEGQQFSRLVFSVSNEVGPLVRLRLVFVTFVNTYHVFVGEYASSIRPILWAGCLFLRAAKPEKVSFVRECHRSKSTLLCVTRVYRICKDRQRRRVSVARRFCPPIPNHCLPFEEEKEEEDEQNFFNSIFPSIPGESWRESSNF